jgi:hypothetical protein
VGDVVAVSAAAAFCPIAAAVVLTAGLASPASAVALAWATVTGAAPALAVAASFGVLEAAVAASPSLLLAVVAGACSGVARRAMIASGCTAEAVGEAAAEGVLFLEPVCLWPSACAVRAQCSVSAP